MWTIETGKKKGKCGKERKGKAKKQGEGREIGGNTNKKSREKARNAWNGGREGEREVKGNERKLSAAGASRPSVTSCPDSSASNTAAPTSK